jgi:hypothetical protein
VRLERANNSGAESEIQLHDPQNLTGYDLGLRSRQPGLGPFSKTNEICPHLFDHCSLSSNAVESCVLLPEPEIPGLHTCLS